MRVHAKPISGYRADNWRHPSSASRLASERRQPTAGANLCQGYSALVSISVTLLVLKRVNRGQDFSPGPGTAPAPFTNDTITINNRTIQMVTAGVNYKLYGPGAW